MSNIAQMFTDYFRKKCESYSDDQWPPNASRPQGWLEEFRAKQFRLGCNISLKTNTMWSKLSGKIYEISHFQLYALLALYDDGIILWLDDHRDDADFEEFVRREKLLAWLPHQIDEFLHLVVVTKFNYLGQPQLINNVLDITRLEEREKAIQAMSEEGQEGLLEEEKRLASIASQIQPPSYAVSWDGSFQLNFCIWTKILGKVIKIVCSFGPNNTFKYEAVQLTEFVGRFFVPS